MPQPKPTFWRGLVIVKWAGDGRCVSKRLESVGAFLYQLRWRLCRSAGEKAKAFWKPELLGGTDHYKDGTVFGQTPQMFEEIPNVKPPRIPEVWEQYEPCSKEAARCFQRRGGAFKEVYSQTVIPFWLPYVCISKWTACIATCFFL